MDFQPLEPWPYDVQNTVIGYWEAWAPTLKGCGMKTASNNIPLGALLHINTAFEYIQSNTFIIHTIDGLGIEHFKAVSNVKNRSPHTRVWLSLGGWTFSNNGTVTQHVWGDLSSTKGERGRFILNLERFMSEWGFDGVDLNWEYPTASDRRGKPEDTLNYLLLCQDIKRHFDDKGLRWGISFTAPASYWYMKHFDIKGMADTVGFVNLMTYDMHGSWDDRSPWIGSRIYSHTNITEIELVLSLLWRNGVPADQVNLGPGCNFTAGGRKGPCTGAEGYLSYGEVKDIIKERGIKPVWDKRTMTKYFRYDTNQWVSYDDPETLKQKVDYANKMGYYISLSLFLADCSGSFRGLFIWAIDQDTLDYELLRAVLGDRGLDYFGQADESTGWTSFTASECRWSQCGRGCGQGTQKVTTVRCTDGEGKLHKDLCCPLNGSPNPDFCSVGPGCLAESKSSCGQGEVLITKDRYYTNNKGQDHSCLGIGLALYYCKEEITGEKLCGWGGKRYKLDDDNLKDADVCEPG
ncbi:hypothetical protein OQA88_11473 [Cercophora sp. LCS_1]